MTIYHTHHIVPKHAGGTDEPSNLIRVTVPEHTAFHYERWVYLGQEGDKIAWRALLGMIKSKQEMHLLVNQTPEKRKKNSIAAKRQWAEGRGVLNQDKIRSGTKEKYGVENIRQLKVTCPHCKKIGQAVAFKRWHMDNCRFKCD